MRQMGMMMRPERMDEYGSYLALDMQHPVPLNLLYGCTLSDNPHETTSCLFCERLPIRSVEVHRDLRVDGQAGKVQSKSPIQQRVQVSIVVVS